MNLILIVCDTLRRDYLGCYGNDWVQSPSLDALSAEGVTFDSCYVGSFPTIPMRHDLMCSNYVFHTTGWAPIAPGNTALQQRLASHGYVTQFITDHAQLYRPGMNYHIGFAGFEWIRGHIADSWSTQPVDFEAPCDLEKLRGPESWLEPWSRNYCRRETERDWPSPQTFATAIEWLERNRSHERFYLFIDTFDVHEPWLPPRHYIDMYNPGYGGDEVIYPRYDFAGYLSDDELHHARCLYAASITMMDRWIGRLVEKVQDLGLWDDTAIAFISDHGWYHGEHGYIGKHTVLDRSKGWQFYDEVARIPLLMRAPNLPRGVTSHALCQPVDVAPTLMELLGLDAPADTHGRSVLKALTGSGPNAREIAVTAPKINTDPAVRTYNAINDGRWTLQHAAAAAEPELYDTAEDPAQQQDLIAAHADVAERLHEQYLDYLAELGCTEEQIDSRRPLGPSS